MVRSLLKLFPSLSFITGEFYAALGRVTAKHPQSESPDRDQLDVGHRDLFMTRLCQTLTLSMCSVFQFGYLAWGRMN